MKHGSGNLLRAAVTRVLIDSAGEKGAYRYACCGLGDRLRRRGDEVFVQPMGCGHKLCPSCSRRRGSKYARRILRWLAYEGHGDLFAICLTQRVLAGESISGARARMAPKQRSYMRWLTRQGLVGAMTTVHCPWSLRADGWHYHVHILVEMPAGAMSKLRLLWEWAEIDLSHRVDFYGDQCRLVLGAGDSIGDLRDDRGDTDFWNEARSEVARAVQYPVRDMAQGVTSWRLGGDLDKLARCATELATQTRGWKMFRAWGRWRLPCPAAAAAEKMEAAAEVEQGAAPAPTKDLGTVGRRWREARKGDAEAREAFRLLEASCKNVSDFAVRLVKFCRAAASPCDTG